MSVQDDYPAITILADAVAGKADDSVPEAVRAWREVARLRQWKAEASAVLDEWEGVWMIAGQPRGPGLPSISKAQGVSREIQRLRSYCDAWKVGVADVVEQFGYDRRAASGPADLLPGLVTLVEQRNDLWERVCELETRLERHPVTTGGMTAIAPDGNDRRPCTCGEPWLDGTIHRTDGQCFDVSRVP